MKSTGKLKSSTMSMRRYTKFNAELWRKFKRHSRDRSYVEYEKFIKNIADDEIRNGADHERLYSLYVQAKWAGDHHYGKGIHYFLAHGVADFCCSAVKKISNDYIKFLYEFNGDSLYFHFPISDGKESSYGLILHQTDTGEKIVNVSGLGYVSRINLSHENDCRCSEGLGCNCIKEIEETCGAQYIDMIKTIMGITLYIEAFPDSIHEITESDEEIVADIRQYNGHGLYVGAVRHVHEEETRKVSPHWRRGHFRVLQSERFKAKRWQSIYIEGFFVKGKAYLIDDDTN